MSSSRAVFAALVLLVCAAAWGCRGDERHLPDGDGDGDGDVDGDSDVDGDVDGDSDVDGDGDGDPECYEDIDIVFVLDVSTTMSYILSTLEAEIGAVWAAAVALDENPSFGLVVFVDDVLVANGGGNYATVTDLQADFHSWYTHTSSNQQTQSTASNGDWPENSLDALYSAASEYAWRDPALTLRIVIHATDDTFLEHPASFSSGIQAQHTYAETVAALQANEVRVAAFAARIGGPANDQDVAVGFLSGYGDQPSIPEQTSGTSFDIDQVGSTISLADAISGFVIEEFCTPYLY